MSDAEPGSGAASRCVSPASSASPARSPRAPAMSRNASFQGVPQGHVVGAGDWVAVAPETPEYRAYWQTLMLVEGRDAESGTLYARPIVPQARITLPETSVVLVRSGTPSPSPSPRCNAPSPR